MRASTVETVLIASGSAVSSPFPCTTVRGAVLIVPPLTSCQLTLEASTQTLSASFAKIWSTVSLGAFTLQTAAGSLAAQIGYVLAGVPFARLATSVAQTADRSFSLIVSRD